MTNYAFYSPKGGEGCSTTAAAFAVWLARHGSRVQLHDYTPTPGKGDLAAILGLPSSEYDQEVFGGLTLGVSSEFDDTVIDWGVASPDDDFAGWGVDIAAMVIRGPSYVALRRATKLPPPTLTLVLSEPGRALDVNDVAACLAVSTDTVNEIPTSTSVARTCDAGIAAGLERHGATIAHTLRLMERVDSL